MFTASTSVTSPIGAFASSLTGPGVVSPTQQQVSYPGQYAGIAQMVTNPANPVLPYGTAGAFDAGALQDMTILRTYGTQLQSITRSIREQRARRLPTIPPSALPLRRTGSPGLKIARSSPPTRRFPIARAVFSPSAYYDWNPVTLGGTKNLYIRFLHRVGCAVELRADLDLHAASDQRIERTSSGSYAWQSGPSLCGNGQSGCSTGQSWEGAQGVYAPNVRNLNSGQFTMFYSSGLGTGSTPWNIGVATSSSPLGPWSKYASNPIVVSTYGEEPDVLVLQNGDLIMFSDTLALSLGRGISTYTEPGTNGLFTPWTWSFTPINDSGGWDSNHVGSQSTVVMPNGDIDVLFGGNNGGGDQIGQMILRLQQSVETATGQSVPAQTSYQDLIANAAGGYPTLARYTAKGVTWVGDATNAASGEFVLGDIGTLAATDGFWRGSSSTSPIGNVLNIDGLGGLNFNVSSGAFGSKFNAWSILPTGQTTQNVSGAATMFGALNTLKPLGNGNSTGYLFGVAASAFNAGLLEFNYVGGAGSNTNTVSLGLYGEPVLTIDAFGNAIIGGHLNQLATKQFAGTCSMVTATTCTFTIAAVFNSAPVCIAMPQNASYAGGSAQCAVSSTTVTITAPTSNSLTWGAMLIGNPN